MNALEMALEALTNPSTIAVSHAIELIRAELAKPEQNKPLRLSPMYEYGHIHDASQPEQEELIQFKDGKWSYVRKPWVGLTNDEIEKIVDLNTSDDGGFDIWCDGIAVARIVCAKLKENNT